MKLYTHCLSPHLAAPSDPDPAPVAGINTTPLAGVLLALVAMLIVIAPAPAPLHPIRLNMPIHQAPGAVHDVVLLKIDANGFVDWDNDRLEKLTDLDARIASAANQHVQPEIHLQPTPDAPYAFVAQMLVRVRKAGLQKVAIVN